MVIKGEGLDRVYIGKLIRDPDISQFGANNYTKTRFRLRFGEGEQDIINVETVFELAERCKDLKKFDNVIAVGKLDNWEDKEGKKRWFLNAELVTADLGVIFRAYGKTISETPKNGFTEIKDDDLPFA